MDEIIERKVFMNKKLINIECPTCGNPIVSKYANGEVTGLLLHKCSRCKRYWDLNYTTGTISWVDGKPDKTPAKNFIVDLSTGKTRPMYDKALMRRKGA
jgi:DNA-directed RNA polymerase subunit RPC12/RpoP